MPWWSAEKKRNSVDNLVEKVNNSPSRPDSSANDRLPPGVLGILSKAPRPGLVKTRLSPPLSPEEAAIVQHLCLCDTVARLSPYQPVIFYSGERAYFEQHFPETPLVPQGEGDLGARMAQALTVLHARAGGRVMLVGSDAPDLPCPLIEDAFRALHSHEAVTIPAQDGGYVLIGERGHHPELFQGVPWSTAEVRARTRAISAAAGWDYAEVGGWEDVDTFDDLLRLVVRAPQLRVSRFANRLLRHSSGQVGSRVEEDALR